MFVTKKRYKNLEKTFNHNFTKVIKLTERVSALTERVKDIEKKTSTLVNLVIDLANKIPDKKGKTNIDIESNPIPKKKREKHVA